LGCEQAPAGRAIKELAESEVACFLFPPSSTREPVHRLMHIQLQCKENSASFHDRPLKLLCREAGFHYRISRRNLLRGYRMPDQKKKNMTDIVAVSSLPLQLFFPPIQIFLPDQRKSFLR